MTRRGHPPGTPAALLVALVAVCLVAGACNGSSSSGTGESGPEDGFTVLDPTLTPTPGGGATTTSPSPTGAPSTAPPTTPSPTATPPTDPTDAPAPSQPPATPTPSAVTPDALPTVALAFEEVARLDAPMAVRTRTGSDSLYVAERDGRLVELTGEDLAPRAEPVLDISGEVATDGERGFLGFDFSADGSTLHTMHNDLDGTSVITEWSLDADGVVDPASRRELMRVAQPFTNHNGGDVHLGPDGMLWFGLGDGGGAGDRQGNGQDTTTLLGSLVRIDPTPTADRPYTIPADNPFADGGGAPEIWAYGLRNPWRFSFDAATGDLWIGDVGQSAVEEIDLLPAAEGRVPGANLGWNLFEGDRPFASQSPPPDHVPPVVVYDHSGGRCSVTGGHVHRGETIDDLRGVYLFGDLCDGVIRGFVPGVGVAPLDVAPVGASLISFGVDLDGESLVLAADGRILRIVTR